MKKVLLIILIFVLVGGLGALIYNKVTGDKKYTQSDIDNAYQLGYETALPAEAEYKKLIKELRQQVVALQEDLTLSEQEKSTAIAKLNAQIEELNERLKAYENAWDLSDKIMVTFYDDDKIYQVVLVTSGQTIDTMITPAKDNYTFVGWLTNNLGEPIADISTVTITESISFYSSYEINQNAILDISSELTFGENYYETGAGYVIIDDFSALEKYAQEKGLSFDNWFFKFYCAKNNDSYASTYPVKISENLNVYNIYKDRFASNGQNSSGQLQLGEEYKAYIVIYNSDENCFSGDSLYQEAYSQEITFTYNGYLPTITYNFSI